MDFHSPHEAPLGARVLPGVDLGFWLLLIVTACTSAVAAAVVAWAVG